MLTPLRKLIKGKTIEELKEWQKKLWQKILYKRKLLTRYTNLIAQMEGNYSELTEEYNKIDRMIFFKEGRVTTIIPRKTEKKKEISVGEYVENLTKDEARKLLEQLLASKDE